MRRNAAALFTEVGGDAVAFCVEEGANSHLPPGIHVTAHDKLRLFSGPSRTFSILVIYAPIYIGADQNRKAAKTFWPEGVFRGSDKIGKIGRNAHRGDFGQL